MCVFGHLSISKVKQESWVPAEVLLSFSPRTRSMIGQLENTPQSRQLVTKLMQSTHGQHGAWLCI